MKPYFKILIVAENAADLKQKSLELAESFGQQTRPVEVKELVTTDRAVKEELVKVEEPKKEVKFDIGPAKAVDLDVELDSSGLPWDERIHVDSKTKKADGTWINRRKLDDEVKAKVEAELRSKYPVVKVVDSTPTPEQAFGKVEVAPTPAPAPQVAAPVMPVPPMPAAPSLVKLGVNDLHTLETFKANLPHLLIGLVNNGKLTDGYIDSIKNWLSIKELVDVIGDEEKAKALFNLFIQYNFLKAQD